MSTLAVKKVKLGDHATLSNNFIIEVPAVANGTLSIKREDGTAVLSIAADSKAVIPGVVGTVAQVGGVVTGQVVERGSNANGEYVRFADGTQICVINALVLSGIASVKRVTGAWTYPAVFVTAPSSVSALTDIDYWFSQAMNIDNVLGTAFLSNTNTGVGISQGGDNTFTAGKSAQVKIQAIGRWF